ncbi:lysophospholipid acyltransferase family protein [Wenzhouxiangella marina]|uniref:lysophospholipid acyltransferase family protein n=1 Tax=Wenzhouxiangella marina TaxID=1579979 RepID=UPI0014703A77|nr:lysophospholipid acyltransferase family protein [Wenzhouxiangella marina]
MKDPGTGRCVVIFAPHTSNWDFVVGILAAWGIGLKVHWIGKSSLFDSPLGPLFRFWGGIPVDRSQRGGMIEQMAERFAGTDDFILAIAPEGTRSHTDHWKSGFWHIARAAQVPVVMAFIDYRRKQIGLGDSFLPGEDIETDFEQIRAFYADKRGRWREKESTIRPQERQPAKPESSA